MPTNDEPPRVPTSRLPALQSEDADRVLSREEPEAPPRAARRRRTTRDNDDDYVAPPRADSSHVAVKIADRLGDAVGVVCVTYLAIHNKISGDVAVGVIAALLGVLSAIRRVGGRESL